MPHAHQAAINSVGHYLDGKAHANGIESFWATLKRAYEGVSHKMSAKHLACYVTEFQQRRFNRWRGTFDQMTLTDRGTANKQLKYTDLIA